MSSSHHHHHHESSSKHGKDKDAEFDSHCRRVFKRFDRDHSVREKFQTVVFFFFFRDLECVKGVLEGREIRAFLEHFAVTASSDERRALVKVLDGRKKLSLDEFKDVLRVARQKHEEKKAELKAAFKSFDKDRSGTIEGRELKALVAHLIAHSKFKSRRELLARLDTNRDGKVSYREYVQMMQELEEDAKAEKAAKRAFRKFDKNGDGVISPSEFRAFLAELSLATSGEQRLKLQHALGNKDTGAFNEDTWVKVYISSLHSARLREESVKKAFKDADRDKSGELSRREVRAILPKLGIDISDEEVAKLFKKVDESGDGQLQFREFQEMLFLLQNTA